MPPLSLRRRAPERRPLLGTAPLRPGPLPLWELQVQAGLACGHAHPHRCETLFRPTQTSCPLLPPDPSTRRLPGFVCSADIVHGAGVGGPRPPEGRSPWPESLSLSVTVPLCAGGECPTSAQGGKLQEKLAFTLSSNGLGSAAPKSLVVRPEEALSERGALYSSPQPSSPQPALPCPSPTPSLLLSSFPPSSTFHTPLRLYTELGVFGAQSVPSAGSVVGFSPDGY